MEATYRKITYTTNARAPLRMPLVDLYDSQSMGRSDKQLSRICYKYEVAPVADEIKIQEIERNTKFSVRPKLCHIRLNLQAFEALRLRQAIKWCYDYRCRRLTSKN